MKEKQKEGIELFCDLITELGDTSVPVSDTIYLRVEQAYRRLTDDVFDQITENQSAGRKYVIQLRKSVGKCHADCILLLVRFDVSMDLLQSVKKEPDEARAEVVRRIRRQVDLIHTFLHEFKSLSGIQKKV